MPRRRKRAEERAEYQVPAHYAAPVTEADRPRPHLVRGGDPQPIGDVLEDATLELAEAWRRRADAIMEQVDMRHPSATALIRHARVLREAAGELTTTVATVRRRKPSAPADSITEHPPEGITA